MPIFRAVSVIASSGILSAKSTRELKQRSRRRNMPMDQKGKFRMAPHLASPQRGSSHPNFQTEAKHSEQASEAGKAEAGGVAQHLKAMHGESGGGTHMHIQSHGGGRFTSHHVSDDGQVQGPHSHASLPE